MNLTSFIGTKVYSIYDCTTVGTIYSVQLNRYNNKVLGFYLFDMEENEIFLPFKNIANVEEYVTINNLDKVTNIFAQNNFNLIGKQIISVAGQDYGYLCDIIFNNTGIIEFFISSKEKIAPPRIMLFGEVIMLGEKKRLKKYKPKKISSAIKTTSTLDESFTVKIMKEETNNVVLPPIKLPPKITYNCVSLLGKKAKMDLFGQNHELLIKCNQTITEKQIELAKQHNKINQLFYSCY